jgi:peptidoglycan/LPS O-acetylase OafA/YrhL
MKLSKFRPVFLLFIIALLVVPFGAVLAKGTGQDADPVAVDTAARVIDMAFLIAITGFFKERFKFRGNAVLIVAFIVGLFLWFTPELSAIHPLSALVVGFLKWFLGALGSFDTLIDVQEKFSD